MSKHKYRIARRRKVGRPTIDRTNEPGTCLYCGRKLRLGAYPPDRGSWSDNAFCNMRCGYAFGIAAAQWDFRLKNYKGEA